MKICLFAFLLLIISHLLGNAQSIEKRKNNAISLEIGKTGLILNLNYDHLFNNKMYGIRAGAGTNFGGTLIAITSGLGGYLLKGTIKNSLEMGADFNYLEVNEPSDDQRSGIIIYPNHTIKTYYANLNFGYRSYGKSTVFRIGLSPGVTKEGFIPGAYISYGIIF